MIPSKKALEISERLHNLIPAGGHTYSKGDDQFPSNAPRALVYGQGSHVWDSDGNEFVDWGMGLRSVILGHCYPAVVEAAKSALGVGANFCRPHMLELELAELITKTIPSAEMVKFAKNGSDTTTAAVLIATLSAPALRICFISSIDLSPPPTVSGMNIFSAVFFTISDRLFLPYRLATTSM